MMGGIAPDFELPKIDGGNLKLSSLRGKAVLLNFWATYCEPCKVEMPWFVELQRQYGPAGFCRSSAWPWTTPAPADIVAFARKMGVNYPILIGQESVGQSYGGIPVMPTTFFLDRNGKVLTREFGLQSRSVFVEHIKQALGPSATTQALK